MRLIMYAMLVALSSACATTGSVETICSNRTGTQDGYFYTFWKDGGNACMTMGNDGAYRAVYDLAPSFNLVVGKGWRTGSPLREIAYSANSFDAGANSYLTLYGWTTKPLVEYYVVESWGSDFRPPGNGAQPLGTVVTDGGTYNIYRTTRVQQPSIAGTATFDQYWSVRTERRAIGATNDITFAKHVEAWAKHGMRLGTMDYQVMATEGFGSKGRSDLTIGEKSRR